MKKAARYLLTITALLVMGYHSVYLKKLDAVKAATSKSFDAKSYARTYFSNRLTPALDSAIEINTLLDLLQRDKERTFDQYSHALGIGNIRFFLVRGEGEITSVNEDDVTVLLKRDTSATQLRIATEFVFGNAIRDASGGIDINAFDNTMDFNHVSAELNKIVRSEVLPPFKKAAKKGATVVFSGAIELNRKHLHIQDIEVIPAALKVEHNQ